MAEQWIQVDFPAYSLLNLPSVVQLNDSVQSAGAQWTPGAQLITAVQSQPQVVAPWIVNGWSIFIQGFLAQAASNVWGTSRGALGKLLAGPIFGLLPPPGGGQTRFSPVPASVLPSIQTIWDGSTDPPFPTALNTATVLPQGGSLAASFSLQQPVKLQSGEQLGFGLWLTPSLVQNTVIAIANVQATISYDDGVT